MTLVKGMKVRLIHAFDMLQVGTTGTIISESISQNLWVDVDWDNFTRGHGCNGKARPNHGYCVPAEYLVPLESYIDKWEVL